MGHWLQNFDRISFWLGFLAASLFWWLIRLLRPTFLRFSQNLRAGAHVTHQERALADEVRIGNDLLRKAQGWHLASALYSLDEVLVPPQFLAPPRLPDAFEPPQDDDITDRTVPYLVDDPELASFYHAPKLGLAESLQGGANLVIVGVPGSGKSVALACLACEQLRKQEDWETPTRTPLLIHIGELGMPFGEDLNADEALLTAAAAFAVSVPKKRLPGVLHILLKEERILLLLDGLDERAPAQMEDASRFLEVLIAAHPGIQIVTTAHLGNLGRLPCLGFQPLTLANWGNAERHQFISRWAELWQIHTRSQSHNPTSETEPLLVTGWLLNSSSALSPLELTLKVWGAFAGDSLGPDEGAVIEAHIRRMMFGQPSRNRNGLEQLASQMIISMDPVPSRAAAELWLSGKQDAAARANSREEAERQIGSGESDFAEVVRAAGALPDLLECGLLISRSAERISLAHPIFTAYLASKRLRGGNVARSLTAQTEWCGRTNTLKYLADFDKRAEWISELLEADDENPLLEVLFQAARWLPGSQEESIWTDQVMRRLAICLKTEGHPISLRFRALSALVQSKQPGVSLLLRQLAIQKQVESQQLAALGLGYLRDFKSIEILSRQSDHPNAILSKAALLALVAIGENTGLEAVGKILLRGDEAKSKDAAEALANDIGEGRDFLLECTELENPNVRRAAVFGLGRTGDPKFEKVLETLSSDDNQWIVQDAAKQQLKQLHDVHPRSPARLPELPQTPWLIEFASDREVGVVPGKPAFQLLERAVIEGNRDQRLAAIYCLGISGNPAAAPPLVQAYAAGEEEILDAVYTGLWNLAACGISIYP